jgi:hypothetical protein
MRQYKRILEQREREERDKQETEQEEHVIEPYKRKTQMTFDLLPDEENGDDNNDDDEDVQVQTKPKSRKKKKKKKPVIKENDEDFLEKEVARVQELTQGTTITERYDDSKEYIEFENLNPENEFTKLFGKSALTQGVSMNEQLPKNIRNNRHHKLNRPSTSSTSTLFVKPKAHWPPYQPLGLSLALTSTDEQTDTYTIQYGEFYTSLQKSFERCIQSHDPNNFVYLLQREHPYHLHTLLQLSEFYRTMQREADQAQDMLERLLFAIQNLFTGNSQFLRGVKSGQVKLLPYSNIVSQIVYHALLARAHAMSRSGAHKTAFELTKLIHSLSFMDNKDPVHVMLFIDFMAIQAGQYQWFLDFIPDNVFQYLPNIMYSRGLALYYLDRKEEATQAMVKAMTVWPMVLCPLLEECKLSSSKWTEWEQLTRNTIFTDVVCTSQVFNQLLSANVKRMTDLYKNLFATYHNEHVVQWLKQCAQQAVKQDTTTELRESLYKDPIFTSNYQQVYAEEVIGNILPIVVNQTNTSGRATTTTHPLLMFLQTLLPWNQLPAEEPIEEIEIPEDD